MFLFFGSLSVHTYIYIYTCVCLLFSYVESSPISQDSYRSMIIRTAPCLGVCQHWFAWVFMAYWKRYWIPVLFCPWISSYDTCDSFFMLFLCCRLQTANGDYTGIQCLNFPLYFKGLTAKRNVWLKTPTQQRKDLSSPQCYLETLETATQNSEQTANNTSGTGIILFTGYQP